MAGFVEDRISGLERKNLSSDDGGLQQTLD